MNLWSQISSPAKLRILEAMVSTQNYLLSALYVKHHPEGCRKATSSVKNSKVCFSGDRPDEMSQGSEGGWSPERAPQKEGRGKT